MWINIVFDVKGKLNKVVIAKNESNYVFLHYEK